MTDGTIPLEPQEPERPKPKRRNKQGPSALDQKIAEGVSAYPNNITFHELTARNNRHSVLLVIAMNVLALTLGAAAGALVVAFGRSQVAGQEQDLGIDLTGALLPAMALGAAIMAVVAIITTIWAWFGGSNAILKWSHAHPMDKQLDAELFNVTEEMAIAAGIPMPRLYLIGDSAMNAFATGRDPQHAAVAITVGLRSKLTRDELQAVIAHEIAHIRHRDIRFALLMAAMVGIIVVVSDGILRGAWYGSLTSGRGSKKGGGGAAVIIAVLAIILAVIAPFLAQIIQMAYSREREYLADAGAAELTRNPGALASALRKLAADPDPLVDTANRGIAHMFIVNPLKKMHDAHQALDSVFASHPPIAKRIARLLALLR